METPKTIHELRKAGWKVRVYHWRYSPTGNVLHAANHSIWRVGLRPHPKGGTTQIELTSPWGGQYLGRAECSKKDSFNRKLGVKIALGRALATVPAS